MRRVAIQGYKGAFHQEAVEKYWDDNSEVVECVTFEEVINQVKRGGADYGVMAVENSLVGCILPNFVLIRESGLNVIGEIYLHISQNLMALRGESLDTINTVESHYMAIAQCKEFLSSLSHVTIEEGPDTALSARNIAQNSIKGRAAIASKSAAKLYGLDIISPSIETNKENYTRFLVCGMGPNYLHESDNELNKKIKTTVAFALPHKVGTLAKVLVMFAEQGANLTMLQSLPLVGQAWEYIFHADLCFETMEMARVALAKLEELSLSLKIMGIYKQNNINLCQQ